MRLSKIWAVILDCLATGDNVTDGYLGNPRWLPQFYFETQGEWEGGGKRERRKIEKKHSQRKKNGIKGWGCAI